MRFTAHLSVAVFLLLPWCAQAQPPFRFAWFTDTHVGSETGKEDLQAVVTDVNSRTDLKFVLVSGDVTEMGAPSQITAAREVLDGLHVPYHVIPGNHDTKWSSSAGTLFRKVFGGERFQFEYGGIVFVGVHQGPWMRMADGHWAPEDLRWLDTAVAWTRGRPLIFVTHYPVDSGICNWYEALRRLDGAQVQVAMVGHGHANARIEFEGVPGVMARATLRDRQRPAGYTIVECRADSLLFAECRPGQQTVVPWTSVARERQVYRMRPGPRPDFRINEDRPEIRPLWVTNTGTTIALRPVITTDLCIVGGADGVIRALSLSDGRQRWSFRTGGPVFSSPDTGRGLVVCGSADGGVYALEAATGEERWRTLTPSAIVGAPAIDGGAVYIGGSDGHLRSLGLDDGRVLWISDSIGGFIEARPAVAESLVIVGAWDGTLYAFGRGDGHIRWSWRGERPGALYAPAACTPVVTQGLVYIVAPDRAMTCLALGTGREVWRSRRHQVRESIGSSPDRTTIFVHTMQDSVVAFDAGSRTPRERWWSRVGFGYDLNPAPPLVVGGELVYGTMKGLVFALDASSGTVRWEHRAGVSLVNPIVSAGTGRFVIADMDGMVQLLTEGK